MDYALLERAIKQHDAIKIREALEAGVDPNLAQRFGYTLLHEVAKAGDTTMGRLLISGGADINRRSQHDVSPLDVAIMHDRIGFSELLLEAETERGAYGMQFESFLDWATQYTQLSESHRRVLELYRSSASGH